jgi:hypothetical protein
MGSLFYYVSFALFSVICIYQLKSFLFSNSREFSYFKTLLILILFLFLLTILGLLKYLFYFKFIFLIIFFSNFIKKKVFFYIEDKIFFFCSFFFIYYCYNSFLGGTDIYNYYGYFSKYLFYNNLIPSQNDSLIISAQYSLPQILFNNFFLNGSNIFSEELCVYAFNIFIILNFINIFDINYLKQLKKIYFFLSLIILFLLMNIFGAEGLSIITDEISIFLILSSTLMILNISKINLQNSFFITLGYSMAFLNKPSFIFMFMIPLLFFAVKFFDKKIELLKSFFIVALIFILSTSFIKFQNFKLYDNKLNNWIGYLNSNNYNNKKIQDEGVVIRPNDFISINKLLFTMIGSEINSFEVNSFKYLVKDFLSTEVYKAAFFAPVKFILQKNDFDKDYFKFLSVNIIKWFTIISLLTITLIFFKKKLKIKLQYFVILYLLFLINIYASFLNEFTKHIIPMKIFQNDGIRMEIIYTLKYSGPYSDYSRYNGWSIYVLFLFLTYYSLKSNPKFLYYIGIFLLLIAPIRAYGNFFHIKKFDKDENQIISNNILKSFNLKNNAINTCLNEGSLFLMDQTNNENLNSNRRTRSLKYFYDNKKIEIIPIDHLIHNFDNNYNKLREVDFGYLKKNKILTCLITEKNSKVDEILSEKFNFIKNESSKYVFYKL